MMDRVTEFGRNWRTCWDGAVDVEGLLGTDALSVEISMIALLQAIAPTSPSCPAQISPVATTANRRCEGRVSRVLPWFEQISYFALVRTSSRIWIRRSPRASRCWREDAPQIPVGSSHRVWVRRSAGRYRHGSPLPPGSE